MSQHGDRRNWLELFGGISGIVQVLLVAVAMSWFFFRADDAVANLPMLEQRMSEAERDAIRRTTELHALRETVARNKEAQDELKRDLNRRLDNIDGKLDALLFNRPYRRPVTGGEP